MEENLKTEPYLPPYQDPLALVSLKSRKNEETELEEGFLMFLQGLETIQKLQKDAAEKKEDYVQVEAENLTKLN